MTWYAGANSTNGTGNTGWVFTAPPGGGTAYSLTCVAGSYAVTGQTATFTYTAGQANYALTCNVGSYAVTGKNAILTWNHGNVNYVLTCAVGSYAVTGQAATFTYTAKVNYALTCAVGSYAVTGKNATLTYVNNGQIPVTKGGINKTKSKAYKDSRKEVEDDISKAIAKVTGEDKPEEIVVKDKIVDNSLEVAEEANIARLQEMVMQAQAIALQAEIDQLIQAELDDEESLMLLL